MSGMCACPESLRRYGGHLSVVGRLHPPRRYGNHLASPSTIGVTSGASFVGYLTLVAFPQFFHILPVASIIGSFATTMIIYFLAYEKGVSPVKMILSGMAVSAMFGAFNDVIRTFFSEELSNATSFMVGTLNGRVWADFRMIFPYMLVGIIICFFLPSKMNILMLATKWQTAWPSNRAFSPVSDRCFVAGRCFCSRGRSDQLCGPNCTTLLD